MLHARRYQSPAAAATFALALSCALAHPADAQIVANQPPLAIGEPDAAQTAPLNAAPAEPANSQTPAIERRPLGAPSNTSEPGAPPAAGARSSGITQTLLALGGVLALAIIGGALVKLLARAQGGLRASLGAGGRAPSGILEVLGRYPIARGSSLVLLKLDRRILLLSQSSQGRLGMGATFTTLCEVDDPEEVASILVKARDEDGDSMAHRFRGMLTRFDRTMDEPSELPSPRRRTTSGPDRAEFWDESRTDIPLVDLTRQPGPAEHSPIASLRKRLANLRTNGGAA